MDKDSPAAPKKPRLLIFIVAYNAEKTIRSVLTRVPAKELEAYETEVLIIDDASRDATFEKGLAAGSEGILPFKVTTLFNPVNQGYGGNQKIGYQYAIRENFDIVALVHGDGQYAPEMLPTLAAPIAAGEADVVFGSRMMTWMGALKGGMPIYKYVGNRILTFFQNWLLRASLSEFHSGYRLYATAALRKAPFHLNSNDFHFDTEIIIEMLFAGQRIKEIPIPTYYGDEISHVNGLKYAKDVMKASLQARMQEYGLFYSRKYDIENVASNAPYRIRVDHALAKVAGVADSIPPGSRVLDIGLGLGDAAATLAGKNCRIVGIGPVAPTRPEAYERVVVRALDDGLPADLGEFDHVLLIDVVERLRAPEAFLDSLYSAIGMFPSTTLIATASNIGFVVLRGMHLIGQFNYGKSGILDLTHGRLFTFNSLRRLFEEAGFRVTDQRGRPSPMPVSLDETPVAGAFRFVFGWLARVFPRAFAYDAVLTAEPKPSLDWLLQRATVSSAKRIETYRDAPPPRT